MSRNQQVVIVEIDFVAPPSGIKMEMLGQRAVYGDVWCDISDGDVVGRHLLERTVDAGLGGIEEVVMIQIVAARSITLVVKSGEHRQSFSKLLDIRGIAARDRSELALTDEPVAKIGKERQIVAAEESGKLKLLRIRQTPDIVKDDLGSMRLILLTRVNRIIRDRNTEWREARNVRKAVVADAE